MIYTLTINPSLDYYINLTSDIVYGGKNRSSIETYEAGGKGVNVSIFLDELGMGSTALGFLGGFTKPIYLDFMNRYKNIEPSFTSIQENTRINITNLSDNTSFNAKGPNISDEEFNKLTVRLNRLYKGDYLVISGNIQDDKQDNIAKVIDELDLNEIKLFIDVDDDFNNSIKLDGCTLVKISGENDFDTIKDKANKLLNKNVKYVLYEDRLSDVIYLFSSEFIYKFSEKEKTNNVHYSDAFIACLVYSFQRGASALEAFTYACAGCKVLSFSSYNENTTKMIIEKQKEITNEIENVK